MFGKCLKTGSLLRYNYNNYRLLSNSILKPNQNATNDTNDQSFANEILQTQTSSSSKFIQPTEIKSLNVRNRIETIEKHGSIFKNFFLGFIDNDILNFPFLLQSRKEFLDITEQYEMVRSSWNNIKKDDETLNLLKYNSLYDLSVSEMMFIFEAIGASLVKKLPFANKEDEQNRFEKRVTKTFNIQSKKNPFDLHESAFQDFHNIREAIETIIPLVERNSIVYYALSRSSNPNFQELLKKKPKIGFAFNENLGDQSDVYIRDWISTATLAYDHNSWVISGQKCGIIDQKYSHYLLFAKTNTFTEMQQYDDDETGVVALLVPSDKVTIEHDYTDYFGVQHQKITFDNIELERNSHEVINATKILSEFSNVKGCGQLAISSIILGLLKQLQKNTYSYLINKRIGLTNCELIQYKLFQSTCKIYALESIIYLTAAMFDSFQKGIELNNESITAKTLAIEYSYEIIGDLRNLFGSRYPFSSTVYDLIYYIDSFLHSSMDNRMYLAREAVEHYKANLNFTTNRMELMQKFPLYAIKLFLQQRKLRTKNMILTKELNKYIHHNLHAACDWIEHCVNQLQFSLYYITNFHKEQIYEREYDLNIVVSMAMDLYKMLACISRANHSYSYGFQGNQTEKEICMAICKDTFLKHLELFDLIDKQLMNNNHEYARHIYKANEPDGYFPKIYNEFEEKVR